ncbi:hypothetical protein PHISP_02477 [Aspergillus sp. HF37]|nr:hypothetical protein PHISP_02477 [Aspergillus sp. HF37]
MAEQGESSKKGSFVIKLAEESAGVGGHLAKQPRTGWAFRLVSGCRARMGRDLRREKLRGKKPSPGSKPEAAGKRREKKGGGGG